MTLCQHDQDRRHLNWTGGTDIEAQLRAWKRLPVTYLPREVTEYVPKWSCLIGMLSEYGDLLLHMMINDENVYILFCKRAFSDSKTSENALLQNRI